METNIRNKNSKGLTFIPIELLETNEKIAKWSNKKVDEEKPISISKK